jgi:FkbM family methyltransferase
MEAGWGGVCVEPNPLVFPYLKKNVEQFDGVFCKQVAVVPNNSPGPHTIWATQDLLSTLDFRHRDKITGRNSAVKYVEMPVRGVTWRQLIDDVGPAVFVNIDVEGINWEVLVDMPWERVGVEMICVEIDPEERFDDMKALLERSGFINHQRVGGNLLAWS